jgi:hypothetical protein
VRLSSHCDQSLELAGAAFDSRQTERLTLADLMTEQAVDVSVADSTGRQSDHLEYESVLAQVTSG